MDGEKNKLVENIAFKNYATSAPWPNDDVWHTFTNRILKEQIEMRLCQKASSEYTILNAGSGNTVYKTEANIIYLDMIYDYVKDFDNYIVASVENIPLENESVDGIVCVGSVLNYVDAQKAISEFGRILRKKGFLILEFERSNSAEFLFKPTYGKTLFLQQYNYNQQEHLLWMYSEHFILELLEYYNLTNISTYRFHCLSSLLYRMGFQEKDIAKYCKYDKFLQKISYPFAHNVLMVLEKY